MVELPKMINQNSVNTIVERCEEFTRVNLRTLCDEFTQLRKGENLPPESKLAELCGKINLIGHKSPPMQLAIAMISNEAVAFVVANTNASGGYFDATGMLRNADGSRSVFDDVDE